ncbi:MAG: hypothetical protein ACLR5G_09985 [Eubacteriales bacterium]
MKKRIPAIIILAAMLLSIGSCGSSGGGNDTDTTAANDTTTDAAATTDYIDTLGEKDFGGKTYTIIIDALCEGTSGMSSVFTQGSLMNLLDLPYLQLDKEGWSSRT